MSQETLNDFSNAIAIVGMAGRFPKAKDLSEFWNNLISGQEVVTFFSQEELIAAGINPEIIKDPQYVPARAVLEGAEMFDAGFFGYSPREAQIIDPQQRLFLETSWEALETAGYDPSRYQGAIGVFGGESMDSYILNNIMNNPEVAASAGFYQIMLGNDKDFLTTRVSYKLNLKGPSVNVQTACSTSLVAVQLASQSLLNYQCDMALAGGVSLQTPRKGGYTYQPGMIMSPDGHCRAFDHRAQGIVSGEGVGVVVLKRYQDAIQDGDTIHAIIRGIAINNDGSLKAGYTAPSVNGQAEAILMAQAIGGVSPETITYVEAHGTGTDLGDPIEVEALTQAFRTGTQEKGFCAIGSVKTHMGHLDAAAGIAGLIKTVLALKHKMLPPNLHFEKPNPKIDFDNSPFFVNSQLSAWNTEKLPRRAAISSFGIGGTNAHAILEEPQPVASETILHQDQVLVLSARSQKALEQLSKNLAAWLVQNSSANLADVAYTLQVGRKEFNHRRFVVSRSTTEAAALLENTDLLINSFSQQEGNNQPVVFLFPGQGAQYVQMGHDLYEHEPTFRKTIDQCAELLAPNLGLDLRTIFFPENDNTKTAEDLLGQTWITQPALFVIEYALAQLLISWGIRPQAMVGHSIGEYVAACLAGVFSLEDALTLVANRGKLMQSLPTGSMLSIPLSESEVQPLLTNDLSLAVINGPKMVVVSGPHDAIERLHEKLSAQGVSSRKLHTSHAFHSIMMEPILAPFAECASQVKFNAPKIPFLSNVTGGWISADQATDPQYWASHIRSTVRFAQNAETLFTKFSTFLEVGPGQTLSSLIRQHTQKPKNLTAVNTIRHPQDQGSDTAFLTQTIGKLWLAGVTIHWDRYHSGETLHRISLPTYPFEHKRYWIDPVKSTEQVSRTVSGKRQDISSWFYLPSWQRSAWVSSQPAISDSQNWLVLSNHRTIELALLKQLENNSQQVTVVQPGEAFLRQSDQVYSLRPDQKEDYDRLFADLTSSGRMPTRILHLWTLSEQAPETLSEVEGTQQIGFYSLLALAQSLSEQSHAQKIDLLVVSNHLFDVTGDEILDATKATLLGPVKVISQELSDIRCRYLDILDAEDSEANQRTVHQILLEFTSQDTAPIVAHRNGGRWIQTFLSTALPPAPVENPFLKQQGVYLITGGYGGIGLTLAHYLAKTVQARLILVGKNGLPDRETWPEWINQYPPSNPTRQKIEVVQELEALGASVLLAKGDVANPRQMKEVIDLAHEKFGNIHGVIHAAGVAGGGIIPLKTRDLAEKVLSPKVQGTWILSNLLKNDPLDFILLTSSTNAIFGGAGQVDYSAANAFLDAFAAMTKKQNPSLQIQSVNWAAWQEVGMAVNTEVPAQLLKWKEENLRNGIHPEEGIEVFNRALSTPFPQIIVSPVDIYAGKRPISVDSSKNNSVRVNSSDSTDSAQEALENINDTRADIRSSYAAPTNEIEKKLTAIWENLIGVEPIGINDNFFELGGHSLLATQILSRIRDVFQIELTLKIFFETNTIAELSKRIDAMLWIKKNQSETILPSEDREEFSL